MRRLVDVMGLRRSDSQRPSVPANAAVFAIGDIHGEIDLLVQIRQKILHCARDLPATMRKIVVYLGDYADYGQEGGGVIDLLLSAPLPDFKSVYLMGNHDFDLLNFIKGQATLAQNIDWLYRQGGLATLQGYGVDVFAEPKQRNINAMRVQLLRKMPTDHFTFLEQLELNYSIGDFFFVHAGVDPSRPLHQQRVMDMISIGSPFLNHKQIYDKIIVHGHTAYPAPHIAANRIGLDTNAHESGILSGLMMTDGQISLIQAQLETTAA